MVCISSRLRARRPSSERVIKSSSGISREMCFGFSKTCLGLAVYSISGHNLFWQSSLPAEMAL
jgi:hypothetical protein